MPTTGAALAPLSTPAVLLLLALRAAAANAESIKELVEPTPTSTTYGVIILVHALCGAAAWMCVAPTAVLIARMGRNTYPLWFRMHYLLQVAVTVTLTVAAVVLAIVAVTMRGGGFTLDAHHVLGFVLLLLVLCQAGLGQYIHSKLDRARTKRPSRNIVHIVLGLTTIIAGYTQVYLGLLLYNKSRPIATYLFTLFWVVAAFFPVLYATSCGFLAWERSREGMGWRMAVFGLGREGGSAELALEREKVGDAVTDEERRRVRSLPRVSGHVRFDTLLRKWGSADAV